MAGKISKTLKSDGDVIGPVDATNSVVALFDGDTGRLIKNSSITEAWLTTLTDNSIANALHRHSELVASDGSPDPALSIDANGNVGIGMPSPTVALDIVGNGVVRAGTTRANAAAKYGYFAIPHYTNAEEDIAIFLGGSDNTNNFVRFGGGSTGRNACTYISFWTTATDTTTTGTEKMRIDKDGNVGIGTITPATSALLDLTSTTGALLLPRMTTAQKNALTPSNGMQIYDLTLGKFQNYEAGAWVSLGGGIPGGADTQIQFNNGGAFGGDADFCWTSGTNFLSLANAEIQSKDSTTGDFTLDATPLVHAWTWDYRAANLIQNRQAQVLATDGTSHSFSAGLALHHVDSDGTNYKTSGTIHQMYGLECQLAGTTTSASYKDMVGVFSRVMNRTEWSSSAGDCGRGCGGFQTEVHQYGAGIADNEFHIFDPSAGAEGGHAQSKSIAGLQIVLHHHFANEDATHISRGLMVDTFGKRITSGITMSSNANAYGSGYAKHAIDMSALKTSDAGIKMPGSVSGSTGTYIEYDPNDYTYYSRSTNAYAWIIGGSQRLATSATATDVAGTLNAAGATNLYGKLSIGPGVNTEYDSNDYSWYDRTSNVFNWIVGGVTGLLVGGSANAVAIRVNSTLLYISRSADVDGTGKHYLVVS